MASWKLTDDNVVTVKMQYYTGWQQDFLKLADTHFDSPDCNRKLLKALLDEAMERDAPISVLGDLFDVMQTLSDKRRDKVALRAEYVGTGLRYLDAVVEDAVEFFRPYVDMLMVIKKGNHDLTVSKYNETDLVHRVCRALGVLELGYAGFVTYQMKRKTGGNKVRKTEFYIHGSGGGGEVNQGITAFQRRQGWALADIYLSGHTHNELQSTKMRARVTAGGKLAVDEQLHVSVPSVKDEWDLHSGYPIEKGMPPLPIGACWLRFSHHPRVNGGIFIEALRAR